MNAKTILLLLLGLLSLTPEFASAQRRFYDRRAIPGTYTVGLYADARGTSREVVLAKGQRQFEVFVGITGDSTQTFSALAMRLELPDGLELDGPIRWNPIPGLKETEKLLEGGVLVEFNQECVQQKGRLPAVLGRIPLRATERFRSATLEPLGHRQIGLGLELCLPDDAWPKPYAQPLSIEIRRKLGFWERITRLFD